MNIDRQEEVVILYELHSHGGRMSKARAIAGIIASGHLKPLPGDTEIRQGRETAIENDLAWARENLKEKGQLSMPERGVWQITQAGRDRLLRIAKVVHEKDPQADWFARYSQKFLVALSALGKSRSENQSQPSSTATVTIAASPPTTAICSPPVTCAPSISTGQR